jgi:hypothetical protein
MAIRWNGILPLPEGKGTGHRGGRELTVIEPRSSSRRTVLYGRREEPNVETVQTSFTDILVRPEVAAQRAEA